MKVGCPRWCVEDIPGDEFDLRDHGVHMGPENTVTVGVENPVFVQLMAADYDGVREDIVDLVLPSRLHAELTPAQARRVAALLILAADAYDQPVPDAGACPAWCRTDHRRDDDDEPGSEIQHFSVTTGAPARGPDLDYAFVQTRLVAMDLAGVRSTHLELIVPDDATDLTGSQARQVAAALLNVIDDLEQPR